MQLDLEVSPSASIYNLILGYHWVQNMEINKQESIAYIIGQIVQNWAMPGVPLIYFLKYDF